MMYNSLKIERKNVGMSLNQNQSKLWKSDLHNFGNGFESNNQVIKEQDNKP